MPLSASDACSEASPVPDALLLILAQGAPWNDQASWAEAWRLLTMRGGYNSTIVILATTLLGVASGVVGSIVLLRRRSMMSDALAHCTLPGLTTAFLVATALGVQGRSLPVLLAGALVSAVLGVLAAQSIVRWTRLREDAAIAIVLSSFFGLGVVMLSYIQSLSTGNQGGLSHFIYGQTAATQAHDAIIIALVAGLAILVTLGLLKEFRLLCFDERFARAIGLPIAVLDLVMMALLTVVVVIGLQAVGLILIVALLVIPACTARLWTERFVRVIIGAALTGALSGYIGAVASASLPRWPAGAVIVLAASSMFFLSMLLAPRRGLISRGLRLIRLRASVARDHALRALYEAAEHDVHLNASQLAGARRWGPIRLAMVVRGLRAAGLVTVERERLIMTAKGANAARAVVHRHRAWERFVTSSASIDPAHADVSADVVEHALSPEALDAIARDVPEARDPGPSIHPLKPEPGR